MAFLALGLPVGPGQYLVCPFPSLLGQVKWLVHKYSLEPTRFLPCSPLLGETLGHLLPRSMFCIFGSCRNSAPVRGRLTISRELPLATEQGYQHDCKPSPLHPLSLGSVCRVRGHTEWAEKNRPPCLDGVYSAALCFPALPLSVEAARNQILKLHRRQGPSWVVGGWS